MKLLSIDYGDKKVGLAIGDTASGVASPFGVIKNRGFKNLSNEISILCSREMIDKIIVGLPGNTLAKSPTETEKKIRFFILTVEKKVKLPIEYQSEIFTTIAARKLSDNKKDDDDIAAMLILQSYLDKL